MGICFSYKYEGKRDWRWRKTGYGKTIHKKSGAYYEGNYRKGKAHGFGTSVYGNAENNAIRYKGNWYRGDFHGPDGMWQSKIIENNRRDKYIGPFKRNDKHGKGKYIYHDDVVYNGNFKDDKYDGPGEILWPAIDVNNGGPLSFSYTAFKGNFVNGLKSGDGKFVSTTGYKFKGTYLDDKFEGHGVLIFADGSKYDGHFFEGQFSGVGKYYFVSKFYSPKPKKQDTL